jgi:hypothetical protein
MRRSLYAVARGVLALSLVVAFSTSLYAAPREKERPVTRIVKKVIRALGDLITIPTPTPPNP